MQQNIKYERKGNSIYFIGPKGHSTENLSIKNPKIIVQIIELAKNLTLYERHMLEDIIESVI